MSFKENQNKSKNRGEWKGLDKALKKAKNI